MRALTQAVRHSCRTLLAEARDQCLFYVVTARTNGSSTGAMRSEPTGVNERPFHRLMYTCSINHVKQRLQPHPQLHAFFVWVVCMRRCSFHLGSAHFALSRLSRTHSPLPNFYAAIQVFVQLSWTQLLISRIRRVEAHRTLSLAPSAVALVIESLWSSVGSAPGKGGGYTEVENPLGGTCRTVDARRATLATRPCPTPPRSIAYLSTLEGTLPTAEAGRGPALPKSPFPYSHRLLIFLFRPPEAHKSRERRATAVRIRQPGHRGQKNIAIFAPHWHG